MFCARCGKPVPAGAAFCPACGAPVAPVAARPAAAPQPAVPRPTPPATVPRMAAPNAGGVAADFEAQKRRTRLTMAGMGAVALIAALFGARSLGLLRLGASSPRPALQARGEVPAPGLQIPSSVPPPSLQLPGKVAPPALQEGSQRKQMPADVEAWLKHLERCEKIKAELLDDQGTKGMTAPDEIEAQRLKALMSDDDDTTDGAPPNKYAKEKFSDDFKTPWLALREKFQYLPPPQECLSIASAYNTGLSQMPDVTTDISNILGGDLSHPDEAIKQVKKELALNEVAQKSFKQADQGVADICAKYDTRKWFDVHGLDVSISPIQMPGSLGGLGGESGLSGLGQ